MVVKLWRFGVEGAPWPARPLDFTKGQLLTFLSRQKVKSRSIFLPAYCALVTIGPLNQIQMIA